MKTCRRRCLLCLSLLGWLIAACGAVGAILSIDLRPGPQSPAPVSSSEIDHAARELVALDPARPTLIAFFHPKCPCSLTTANELAGIAAGAGDRLAVRIVRLAPANEPLAWQGDMSINAALGDLRNTRVIDDVGGRIADAFGAKTSGHCVLYSAGGQLEFTGGITPSRGHAGPSKGHDAIEQLLSGRTPTHRQSEVYGCLLHTPGTSLSSTPTLTNDDRTEGACISCP